LNTIINGCVLYTFVATRKIIFAA